MAAKRISRTAIDWAKFAECVEESDMQYFRAIKARNSTYERKIASGPEQLPKIDWSYYKSKIAVSGLVDSFQKSYESLNIPYPSDQGLIAKVDEQEKQMKSNLVQLKEEFKKKIEELQEKLKKLQAQKPFTEMTLEEYAATKPKYFPRLDFPTFYPHGKEEWEFSEKLKEEGKL